jgi:hypothetical protein
VNVKVCLKEALELVLNKGNAIYIFGMTEQFILHSDGYFSRLLSTELHMKSSLL